MVSGSVKCIKESVENDVNLFTTGQTYGVYSQYNHAYNLFELITCDDENNTHIIADAKIDDFSEFVEDEWFKEHFILLG